MEGGEWKGEGGRTMEEGVREEGWREGERREEGWREGERRENDGGGSEGLEGRDEVGEEEREREGGGWSNEG